MNKAERVDVSQLIADCPDDLKGWVIRSEVNRLQRDMVTFKPHVAWWYGPDHGFGTTYGDLWLNRERWADTIVVAVWPTRKAAQEAKTAHLGRRKGITVQRLADAITEATSK